jgi:hypothetical protein
MPASPRGMNTTTATNSSPISSVHSSGYDSLSTLFAPFIRMAPSTAPTSVPRPPIATHSTISMDGTMPIIDGEMMPTCSTNNMPASPASPAETQNAVIW